MNPGLWDPQGLPFSSFVLASPGTKHGALWPVVPGERGSGRRQGLVGGGRVLVPHAHPCSPPTGRKATLRCLTTTSRRAGWTSVRCTWHTSGHPAALTASSLRRLCSPAGPRRGPLCSPTHPGGPSSPIAQPATTPSPGLCSDHTPPKTFNLWILPPVMCRADRILFLPYPGDTWSHLKWPLDLWGEEEGCGDLCTLLPTPAP